MQNITLCQYSKCPQANNCLRDLQSKTANEYSSYAEFKTVCNEKTNYPYLWEKKYSK